jgi:hypothetical protein
MKRAFRYNRQRRSGPRPPRGYVRWLGFWLRALARAILPRRPVGPFVWAEDGAAELLLKGFPALFAVPAPLFEELAGLFPGRLRLAAEGKDEEELLACIRRLELCGGKSFDWDAFLTACERQTRRAHAIRRLAESLASLAPPELDAASPRAALHTLSERNKPT